MKTSIVFTHEPVCADRHILLGIAGRLFPDAQTSTVDDSVDLSMQILTIFFTDGHQQIIPTIKSYRTWYEGAYGHTPGLKESKDTIEEVLKKHNLR